MTETGIVTWLHLSDLHTCKPKTGWDAKSILENLKTDFKKIPLQPDLIFFTGDAAFGHIGAEEGKSIDRQFDEAAQLFEEIRTSFSPPVPKENIFFVPGNHDANRDKEISMMYKAFDQMRRMKHDVAQELLTGLIRDKDNNWQGIMQPWQEYAAFLEKHGYNHLLQDRERLIYAHIREINGIKMGIAGFHSAWSCHKNSEKGKLWLAGNWQIKHLSRQVREADVKIACMHHPFSWFHEAEGSGLERSMQKNFDFLLHGHEHDAWVKETKQGFSTIAAGACYAGSAKELGYNMVRWHKDKQSGEAWLRTYDPKGEGWVAELIAGETDDSGGVWNLGKKAEKIFIPVGKPPTLGEKKQDIQPDSPESRGIFGRKEDIKKIGKALGQFPMVGMYGMAGVGKSQIVKEIKRLPPFKEMEYVPCYINKYMDMQSLFRQLARALGCNDEEPKADFKGRGNDTYDFSTLKTWAEFSKPAFIHLIDAHFFFQDYKLKTPGIKEFLEAIARYYPRHRVILESRITLKKGFSSAVCDTFYIGGIDSRSMALYFKYPFKEDPSAGWKLEEEQQAFLFKKLGAHKDSGGAMPLAMMLLANVAKGRKLHPVQVLTGYEAEKEFVEKLENRLFMDLYDNVLTEAEQHMLRLCAIYREGIPNHHGNALNGAVGAEGIFWNLAQRCLLDRTANEDWFFLHAIIAQLTRYRIEKNSSSKQYWDDHDTIADAWLAQLKLSSHPSLPNIKTANEAFHHLTESESYDRYYELSDKLLDKEVIPHLEQLTRQLSENHRYKEDRQVLELLVRLEPKEPKYHRFLAQIIEKLERRGNDEALKHYWQAYRLKPGYPEHLNVLGRCLLARGEAKVFIEEVEKLHPDMYKKVMTHNNLAIYARCLEKSGDPEAASRLRQEQIHKEVRHPAFYNDEANYLAGKGSYDKAMDIIKKAEKIGIANEFILSVKATILKKSGDPEAASQLRQEQIHKGSLNPAFYNDEANYLAGKGRYNEAMDIIKKAEDNNSTDQHTLAIKTTILEKSGDPEAASRLRQEQIHKEVRHPAFYNDEANYLAGIGHFPGALKILDKAEALGIANEYIRTMREKIERLKREGAG